MSAPWVPPINFPPPPWSSGGSATCHHLSRLVVGPCGGALSLCIRCCALTIRS
jgi:hypothetical protein